MRRLFILIAALACAGIFPGAACAGISVIGSLTREDPLAPGGVSSGTIRVKNTGKDIQRVKVSLSDYRFYADGRNIYADPGSTPRSNAGWVRFNPAQVELPPGTTSEIAYEVSVPAEPGLAGTYWSMLMVRGEPVQEDAGTGRGLHLRQVFRYGVQMITDIGESGTRSVSFSNGHMDYSGDASVLIQDLENTGERVLRPFLWIELYDRQGMSAGRFDSAKVIVYPECSARFHFDLSRVRPGTYTAVLVADCGGDDVFGIRYTLEIARPVPAPVPASKPVAARKPSAARWVALALLLLVFAFSRLRRRAVPAPAAGLAGGLALMLRETAAASRLLAIQARQGLDREGPGRARGEELRRLALEASRSLEETIVSLEKYLAAAGTTGAEGLPAILESFDSLAEDLALIAEASRHINAVDPGFSAVGEESARLREKIREISRTVSAGLPGE